MILTFLACARPVVEPLPEAYHLEMEAAARARVPDPVRGGPPIQEGAAPLPPFIGVDRATARYVGAAACAACHPAAAKAWEETGHHRALEALQERSAAYNPACLRCHVTGFGQPGGWTGASSPLTHIQCEACHGPGSDHVAAPAPGYGALPADGSACVACHTWENSPDFRFDLYWPKIVHTKG